MILVADDDAQIRDVVRIALTQAGLGVAEVGDGRAALEKAESLRPDLIILDIGMPEMDGLEVCRALRKTSDVPILFLTARAVKTVWRHSHPRPTGGCNLWNQRPCQRPDHGQPPA